MTRSSVFLPKLLTLLVRSTGENDFGEQVENYVPSTLEVRGVVQPAGAVALERASLQSLRISHEVYLRPSVQLEAETQRLVMGADVYHIRDVKVWPLHTHVLLEEV